MITAQKATVGLRGPEHSRGGGSKGSKREPLLDAPPTLAEAGIDKKLSSRAQKLAKMPEEKFEAMVGEWRGREFNRLRAASFRARKKARDGLPKRITGMQARGAGLIKFAKGLGKNL
jgi:hypothetical protein